METRDRKTLRVWPKNYDLRIVEAKDYERMKQQILMGQHSNYLIRPDGLIVGGNTRYRACDNLEVSDLDVYNALKLNEAKCNILDFKQDPEKAAKGEDSWYAILDGTEIKTFYYPTEEDGMIAYSFSHNDEIGRYNKDAIANLHDSIRIPWTMFSFSTEPRFNFGDMIQKYESGVTPGETTEEKPAEEQGANPDEDKKYSLIIQCDSEHERDELNTRLTDEGYICELP